MYKYKINYNIQQYRTKLSNFKSISVLSIAYLWMTWRQYLKFYESIQNILVNVNGSIRGKTRRVFQMRKGRAPFNWLLITSEDIIWDGIVLGIPRQILSVKHIVKWHCIGSLMSLMSLMSRTLKPLMRIKRVIPYFADDTF